jgi:hypothetical protein
MEINDPTYKVGQLVWLNIPEEGSRGLIIDIVYYPEITTWKYAVRFPSLDVEWLTELELSKKKRIV